MRSQFVRNIPHLIDTEIDIAQKEGELKVAAIPTGSVILHASVEVKEVSDDGVLLDLGVKGAEDVLLNDFPLNAIGFMLGAKPIDMPYTQEVIATLNTKATKGVLRFRFFYFTPSQVLNEV